MSDITSHISEPFNIAGVRVANRLVQAPMAGITGRAFRLQARRFGAGLLCTEMVSSYGVTFGNRRTAGMMTLTLAEHPAAVQLFGNKPDVMAEAAAAAEAAGASIIDINMGCPVRKVVKTGAGVALMEDEELAARIVAAIAGAVAVPVTAKIRSGLRGRVTAPSLGRRLEAAGAAALAIHPRLAEQGRRGKVDHAVTNLLVKQLEIPVIASGGVQDPAGAAAVLAGGASAVMVGQAALGNPWLFADLLAGTEPHRLPLAEVLAEMGRFYADLAAEQGNERAGRAMRKFYGWYLKPFKPGKGLAEALRRSGSFKEAAVMIREKYQQYF